MASQPSEHSLVARPFTVLVVETRRLLTERVLDLPHRLRQQAALQQSHSDTLEERSQDNRIAIGVQSRNRSLRPVVSRNVDHESPYRRASRTLGVERKTLKGRETLVGGDFVDDGIDRGVFERRRQEHFAQDPRVSEAEEFLFAARSRPLVLDDRVHFCRCR